MPIYLYKCNSCKSTFEKIQNYDSVPPRQCVSCGSESVEKQVSAPSGFRLKGSGWYETDFKGK
jgi:putative FmdB family regulatory protein